MQLQQLEKNLKKRGFSPFFADNSQEAIEIIKELIPKNNSIGFGGSVTVDEIGLLNQIKDDYKLLHRSFYNKEQHEKLYKEMMNADWYITSTNALTMDGELVNIDGRANRVASMLFGPKNVLVILGKNKLVSDVKEGILRCRNVAAPPNAVRLNKKTPCRITNKCEYCMSEDTMCKATVIQHHPTSGKNVYVLIIDQSLGY
ncbi:MAG: lactate utilization protein [Bacillota bacterium]